MNKQRNEALMTTNKLQAVLALAERNNLPAIWRLIGRSTADLALEVGDDPTIGDRQDLTIVSNYVLGNGKAHARDAVKALKRLAHRLELRNADVRNRIFEDLRGTSHVEESPVLVHQSFDPEVHYGPDGSVRKAELVEAARIAAKTRGEICRVGAGTKDKALETYVAKRVPSAEELLHGKSVKLADWKRLNGSPLARLRFAKTG